MLPATLDAMYGASAVICVLQTPESTFCISFYFAEEKNSDHARSNHPREEDVVGKVDSLASETRNPKGISRGLCTGPSTC